MGLADVLLEAKSSEADLNNCHRDAVLDAALGVLARAYMAVEAGPRPTKSLLRDFISDVERAIGRIGGITEGARLA